MGILVLIISGSILGWLAAIIADREDGRSVAQNVAVGIGGALLAGLVLSPHLGIGDLLSGRYDVDALLLGLTGSLGLLVIVSILRRDIAR